MARRKHRPRTGAPQPQLAHILGKPLPTGALTKPTNLTHKGRPVVWSEGILYCDGRAIGRRPKP